MSSADDMEDASWFLDQAKGRSISDVITNGIAGWALASFSAAITGMQNVLDLILFTPVDVGQEIIWASGEGFIIKPLNEILPTGSEITAGSLEEFGLIAFPVGVVILLLTYWIITRYLRRGETTDMPFPGIGIDVIPFVGVEEESPEENEA